MVALASMVAQDLWVALAILAHRAMLALMVQKAIRVLLDSLVAEAALDLLDHKVIRVYKVSRAVLALTASTD